MAPEQSHTIRHILRIAGPEARAFLQGLITNDVAELDQGLVYAALLTPQGKFLSDFFLVPDGDDILLDMPADLAEGIQKKLTLYKLRAKVTIETTDLGVECGLGPAPEGAWADPRTADLGWRRYGPNATTAPDAAAALEAKRITLGVPATGIELIPGETYILEARFDQWNGVNFKKGCFVGQEIVARMKHKIELRKGLCRVRVTGQAPAGTEILRDGKAAGVLYSQHDGLGIAQLRFDRAGPGMTAAEASVTQLEDA